MPLIYDSNQLLERVLAGGDDPERRALHARHFASGPPRKLIHAFDRLPLEHARVLDLGCGYGTYLAHFSEQSVGVDRDASRVEFARSLGLDARCLDLTSAGWMEDLGEFEYAWACDMLPHLEEPGQLLNELQRVLGPGGRVLVSDWLWPSSWWAKHLALALPGARAVHDEPEHFHVLDRAMVEAWLDEAGFVVEESWVPSFRRGWQRACVSPFWPPRTLVARREG